jgi:hypothetical protein
MYLDQIAEDDHLSYIRSLQSFIEESKLSSFFCFVPSSGLQCLEAIKKTREEVLAMIRSNIVEYIKYKLAHIVLIFNPNKKYDSLDWVFCIKITIYIISDNGDIDTSIHDSWSFVLNYNIHNIHKFNIDNIRKLVNLVAQKIVFSGILGIAYDDFVRQIDSIRKKCNK